jgi:beta-galactosidase
MIHQLSVLCIVFLAAAFAYAAPPDASPAPVASEAWRRVAQENPATDWPHMVSGERYAYGASIPATAVPANDPLRKIVFGNPLTFHFSGLVPTARYQVRIVMLADTSLRTLCITANDQDLKDGIKVPAATVLPLTIDLPPETYTDKMLDLTISPTAGENGLVSTLEVWSTSDAPLGSATAPAAAYAPVTAPRLTPAPLAVAGLDTFRISLDGAWQFNPAPHAEFWKQPPIGWASVQVPGEWVMQGFNVPPNGAAAYARTFTVPADWSGRRIKLRCDAVYSDAVVYVNGQQAGKHLGGFTPFELDVTPLLQPGKENHLALAVKSDSVADVLASGNQYAAHSMGGITRKMYLLALPEVNVAGLQVSTHFDSAFRDATLHAEVSIANESPAAADGLEASLELLGPDQRSISITPAALKLPALAAGQIFNQTVDIPVPAPAKWDNEHPNLYVLRCKLQRAGTTLQTVDRRFGFRQVEVRGNELFVNNQPIKLRGVCRHEVHPLLGRSLTPEQWRKDAELYRACNCNYIRTSHYPPAEEFIDACDELGLFVESEAGLCWVQHGANSIWTKWNYQDRRYLKIMLLANLEKMQVQRSHPSVIIWSLANESRWSPLFAEVLKQVQAFDPTRPETFHDQCWGGYNNAHSTTSIGVYHYPGMNGPGACAKETRPILFGEYCHLNAYNRREQIGDPGLRDVWGLGLAKMWELMRTSPGCLGGSIWAAMDDTFFLPDGRTVGYGTWGPLDAWRRPKPEYWHVAKSYSPIHITQDAAAGGDSIHLTVENRSYFADLSEFSFAWTLGSQSGTATASAPPGQSATLSIPAPANAAGKELEVRVTGPRHFMVDAYRFTIGDEKAEIPPPLRPTGTLQLHQDSGAITVTGEGFRYTFDAATGLLRQGTAAGHDLPLNGPVLTLVPLDGEGGGNQILGKEPTYIPLWGLCTDWKASTVTAAAQGNTVVVNVAGAYDQAAGTYEMTIDATGRISIAWKFSMRQAINPRQLGITFSVPATCDTLSWRRKGQWSWYPEDHIGRPIGTAAAFSGHTCGLAGPRTEPSWPWSQDQNQYGSNDFRSTKFNIFSAAVTDHTGLGLRAVAAADRHAHAWIDGTSACLLVADYANDGAEGFFQCTRAIPNHPLNKGATVTGSAQMELVGPIPPR